MTIIATDEFEGGVLLTKQPSLAERVEDAEIEGSYGTFVNARTRRMVETDIMISLAGGFTMMRAMGVEDHETGAGIALLDPEQRARLSEHFGEDVGEKLIGDGDYQKVVLFASTISGGDDEARAYIGWLEERTLSLLRHPGFWPLVEVLVPVLLDRGTLTGAEVRALFGGATLLLLSETAVTQTTDAASVCKMFATTVTVDPATTLSPLP